MDTPLNRIEQDTRIEHPIDGLEIEYRCQGRMLILGFTSMISPRMVDTAYEAFKRYVASQTDGVRHMVYDASHAGMLAFNPYVSRKLTEMAETNPGATGRVAVVLPAVGPLRPLVDYFIRKKNNRLQPKLQVRLFADREKAINWVLEIMPTAG